MKRFLFICLSAMMLFSLSAEGAGKQDRKPPFRYEVRAGWGGVPFSFYGFDDYFESYDLNWMYRDYTGNVYTTGVISAEFSLNFRKWFSLAFNLGYTGYFTDMYSGKTDERLGRKNGYVFAFMPQARFVYLSRPMVSLYSSIGIGIAGGSFLYDNEVGLAAHLTLLGVTFGKRVFGIFELGGGTDYVGCMAGIGYRF